jgi:hypothetical protein
MPSSSRRQTRKVKSPRPSSLLAARVVVQPYGFWHRPWVRAGAMAVGLMLGVLAASWFLAPDAEGPRGESVSLRVELDAAQRALDAERLRAAELAREVETLGREAQRLRAELGASQQKAAKRRERRESADEVVTARPSPVVIEAPLAETPAAAPRAE